MITEKSIIKETKDLIQDLESQIKRAREDGERTRLKAVEFGGFVDRDEVCKILNISQARVGVLIARGEFREWFLGYSLADVESYKKNRKPGRPSKTKKHNAAQLELKM